MSGDDIVERLGHITADDEHCRCLKCEAAAEIERLREQVQYRDDVIAMLRAEHTFVERLVAGQLLSRMTELEADLAAERAEVERLTGEVERAEGQRKLRADLAYLMKAEKDDALAEVMRLRALVDSVLACDGSDRTTHVTVEIPFDLYHALEEARRER